MAESPDDELIYTVVGDKISGSYIPTGGDTDTDLTTPGAVISATSGGIKINLVLDAAAQAAPQSFKNGLQQAAAILAANITDQITVNIKIDYSGTGGGAAAGPDQGLYETYAWTRSALINNASQGDTTFNSLPNTTTIQGQSQVAVWNAQLKLWGVLGANDTTTDDASAKFSTDISPNLLVGVALHELTHAWGRVPYGAPYTTQPDIFDLFRFTSPGVRLFNGASTAPASYFSLDGGNTKIADYGQTSDPSDFLNSGVQGPSDPFNEFYNNSTIQGLTAVDLQQLDALGFHLTANAPTTIEAFGVTSLSKTGNYYFLNPTAGGGGPSLKYNGVSVVVGQFGSIAPIGAEQAGSGYDVAWKVPGADQYTVWSVDSNGNYLSTLDNAVPGMNYGLESIEPIFHQDLNGDGVIGVVTNVIESAGVTSLTQVANNYYFYHSGVGPELARGGVAVLAGQFAPFVPIGAEKTSTGYDLVWKMPGADQYIVWNVDNNGNFVANLTSIESANSSVMESFETIFHQDFNGDSIIGPPATTVIESAGTTSLAQIGSNYFFLQSGAGPELMRGGAAVVAGQFAPFVPIGAEKTSTGYDLAWKATGADQYIIWSVDSSGNFVSNLTSVVSGTSNTIESFENVFHQDLNGDSTIGIPGGGATTVIESAGATSLTQVGSNYFLYQSGSGPELARGGAPVVASQFAPFAPIGAEKTSTGYDVAWKATGADQYIIWSTDSSGNFLSNLTSVESGSSNTIESFENVFHQDLNGDGTTGIPGGGATTVIEAAGNTSLTQIGSNFYFLQSGSGPELMRGGAAVVANQFAPFTPIGVEKIATGYDLAWKATGADQYIIWNVDNSGNFVSNLTGVESGSSSTLTSYESLFQQDLNGDGVIGPSAASPVASALQHETNTVGVQLAELLAHDFIIR